ncbi:hypothetical protein AM493_17380 [Flavobacterium akiainvivens]|uniref:Ig-like domain-containing protein n=1 Tax=Flavobacterium akiainvivens TaxID=1202724 RepID=A0A0M8MF56_9FLAO|nr:hypothetical protein AM493_17380 [Flavobacterium akiainvivens]
MGNGSLAFSVTGNDPGATMSYSVYLLPNTTTPISIVTTPTLGGLTAGSYQVVATQTLGGVSNTSTANVTIANNVVSLAYTLVPTAVRCGTDGKITVQVNTGTAVNYEIISGPLTVPLQTSNVFSNLPVGTYQVRVYDACGEAVVTTIQLTQLNPGFTVATGGVINALLPSCTTVQVGNHYNVGANLNIFYPLTAQFTVFPPGGGTPTVVTGTAAGDAVEGDATAVIPFYYDQQYTYNVVITDACGNTYTRNNNIVNAELSLSVETDFPNCTDAYFTLTPAIYMPPYTLTFTAAPDGFDPEEFNSSHPTFTDGSATYGNTVPTGDYAVSITDACGHTATLEFEVTPPDVSPSIVGSAACGSTEGNITITIPARIITVAIITQAPDAYEPVLPNDVSGFINAFGALELTGMPIGMYEFYLEDACGEEYTETFLLTPSGGPTNLTIVQRPGCAEGEGSVRISVGPGIALEQVLITDAPDAFTETLPYDLSSYIVGSVSPPSAFMNSLPEGVYTFLVTDGCGVVREQEFTVNGYHETQNDFTVLPLCHAFHLQVNHTATTGVNLPSFFLQRYNPITGTWGHPETNVAYTDGTLPTITNSRLLTNNFLNLNVMATGDFRVIKVYYVYSNGSSSNFRCMHEVANFTFDDAPEITDAYTFPCAGGTNEVIIEATGVAPLTYSITSKNGDESFVINNGTSNLFSGLESATYNFRVVDYCGNIRNIQFDINALEPTQIEALGFCEGEDSSLVIDEFDFLTYEWYAQDNPGVILSTTGTLQFPAFSSTDDAGTYILHITYDVNPDSCLNQTLEYEVAPNTLPNAGTDAAAALCNEGEIVNLESYLTGTFDTGGTWTETTPSGALTGNQFDTDGLSAGVYTFTYSVGGVCGLSDEATLTLTLKNIPVAPVLTPVAAVCETENVQLFAETVLGATYHWDGPNGYTSTAQNPLLAQATPGMSGNYSAYVTVDGCVSPIASVSVTVNATPQFSLEGAVEICEGQSTVVTVVPANFTDAQATYAWYEEGMPMGIATAGIEIFTPGEYQVTATVNGCEATRMIIVTLNTDAFSFELEAGCVNENYIISVINPVGVDANAVYEWVNPDGSTHNGGAEYDISEGATGEYSVTITSADGCFVTQSIQVDNTFCKIPRGISPNGDEFNNNFDLSNLDVQHLVIFNRYGLKVYEANNYIDEWHGQSDKGELPTGTYYYVATLSAGMKKTGWVYLQREAK